MPNRPLPTGDVTLMSIPRGADARRANALTDAHRLADMGVPVFRGRLTAEGNPDRLDKRWLGWQNARPGHTAIDRWRPGEALCAVTGYAFDVLDYDPRNGGHLSIRRLSKELGEDGPDIYWEVHTPSGGKHMYVASLGIGKHTGFMPGLDLQGGRKDGTGRGFVFIPPTVRISKASGEPEAYYALTELLDIPEDAEACEELRSYILNALGPDVEGGSRTPVESLRRAVIAAAPGEQRPALLRYVHERERIGDSREDILAGLVLLTREMPVYDNRNPWYPAAGHKRPDYWLRGLLHRPGTVIPDGQGELDGASPIRKGLIQWVHDIKEAPLSWLWYGRLALGELTLLDGAKGKGKSFITYDIIARATNGDPMPGEDEAERGPIKVILFTDEGGWDTTIRPRLRAAGADLTKVARVSPAAVRKNWGLPAGAQHIGRAIAESGATLAIFDPITDMIGEEVNSHNDASVRRALAPLAAELSRNGCAGLAIRHFNKAIGVGARNRGSGSAAFQNRARVHMVTGELPVGAAEKFGIAIVDTNLTSKEGIDAVIGYTIVDSDVPTGDRQGTYHGAVSWGGPVDNVNADELADGPPSKPGPAATRRQEVIEMMAEMFSERDEWPADEAIAYLESAGVSTVKETLRQAKSALSIRSVPVRVRGERGVQSWIWTTRKATREEGTLWLPTSCGQVATRLQRRSWRRWKLLETS